MRLARPVPIVLLLTLGCPTLCGFRRVGLQLSGNQIPALLTFILTLFSLTFAQTSPAPATITFTLDFPQSTPDHYQIVVDSSGKATYTSGLDKPASHSAADSEADTTSTPDQPYHYSFTVSPATRDRIFDLAARANYFSGDVNYTKHNVANTGEKVLTYKDAQRISAAKYNYTTNLPVQQLTALFQDLSLTLEYGRRLEEDYRYQKLALEEQLKSMEQQADQNALVEVQAIAPILKKIIADSSVLNVTRARAERLLAKAENATSPR